MESSLKHLLLCLILIIGQFLVQSSIVVESNSVGNAEEGSRYKRCTIKWRRGMDYLNSQNIDQLDGCTSIEGHLRIIDATFNGDRYFDIPPLSVDQLHKLKTIKQITEYLFVHNLNNLNVTSLNFLSNLQAILGRSLNQFGASLSVVASGDLQYLGLTALKKISSGHVVIDSNENLCFLEEIKWKKLLKGKTQRRFIRSNANEASVCVPQNKTCHVECRNGCWGFGNHQCVSCQHYRYRDECVFDCSRPMVFNSLSRKKKCFDCNPECLSSCTGTGADKCDACRNYKDGPFCVNSCPNDTEKQIFKYPDANNTCQPCHKHCSEGCTGPNDTVGEGGCNLCKISVADRTGSKILRCLNESDACPKGYYANRSPVGELTFLQGNTVCMKCNDLCEECYGSGTVSCSKCKHYKYADRCVESCPPSHYANNVTSSCVPCHSDCRSGCNGPTSWDCQFCLNYKTFNDTEYDNDLFGEMVAGAINSLSDPQARAFCKLRIYQVLSEFQNP